MKITQQEKELIARANLLYHTEISNDVFEKDFLLNRVIMFMSSMSTDEVTPIFCGGTSLSKAHGVISRMSEDVDFKLAIDGLENVTRNQRRRRLSRVKKYIQEQLVKHGCGLIEPRTRDENRFFRFDIPYEPLYRHDTPAIKPYIQLECINIKPAGPVVEMPVYSIISRLTNKGDPIGTILCESLQETAAEKTVGMLRRFGTAMRKGYLLKLDEDPRPAISYLSRHIYDLAQIFKYGDIDDNEVATFVKLQIENDQERYSRSSKDFHDNPIDVMSETLNELERSEIVREYYERRLSGIIFDGDLPPYQESMQIIKGRLDTILDICKNDIQKTEQEPAIAFHP